MTILFNLISTPISIAILLQRPVYRSNSTNQKWVRIRSSVRFIKEGENAQLYFEHSVDADNDKIFFAFTYPYSYTQVQTELANYDIHINRMDAPDTIFYQRELLTNSCDGRRLDLLTISSVDGASSEREPLLPGLFPDTLSPSSSNRPPVFSNKEVIIVSARVHPGEVPAQHTFKGVLSLLMDPEDQTARELRSRYVFKLIPMLNPDGVYRGHFRMDQHGHNLNRYYNNPDPTLQPTIFAAKSLLDYYSQTGRLSMYLDMHAHASKRGCFIYGNVLDQVEDQIQNQLYCKLISMNSPHFDYEGCLFSREHMFRIDPGDQAKGLTAEGSGRVHTYLAYGLVHSYTLECNYNTSRIGNEVAPPEQEILGQNVTPPSPFTTNPEKYTPSSWSGVGRACIVAMLDIRGQNPCSRIPKSKFKTLDRVRNAVVMEVRNRKEYQGKQMSRERRRSIADKKLTGSSATQSDEFVWRRVVDGYEVQASGARSGASSARSSSASLTLAAAAAAAMEHQARVSAANENSNQNAASYLFIPAGKEKRRKTITSVPTSSVTTDSAPGTARRDRDSLSLAAGIAAESDGAGNSSTQQSSKFRKPPIPSSTVIVNSMQNAGNQREEDPLPSAIMKSAAAEAASSNKEKYQHLEKLILESQSAKVSNHKSLSPPQTKDAAFVANSDANVASTVTADTFLYSSPSGKALHGPLIGNTTKQMQQYFHSFNLGSPTSPQPESGAGQPSQQQQKPSRPRSADALKSVNASRRERNSSHAAAGSNSGNNSHVTVEVLVPNGRATNAGSTDENSSELAGAAFNNYNTSVSGSPPAGAGGAESRSSKSSDSSRLGVGASIRDLIREQSIQKLIKLSANQSSQTLSSSATTIGSQPAPIPGGNNARRHTNVAAGSQSPSSNKDNRKILGKTLHAAGVALLMQGAPSSSIADNGQSHENVVASGLSVQGMSASSRNSSHVSLQDAHIPIPIPHHSHR